MNVTEQQIEIAAENYPHAVTGAMSGCRYPGAVLRWALMKCTDAGCRRLAENYVRSGHGACWNAMVGILPANGWLVWYTGDWEGVKPA